MKRFRLVLLMVFCMLVFTPVKAEAADNYLTELKRSTIEIVVGESKLVGIREFGTPGTTRYHITPFSNARRAVATSRFNKVEGYVEITGNACGTTFVRVYLSNGDTPLGHSTLVIKVIEKPYMKGKATMDIKQSATFKNVGSDAVKWWSKNKKVATVSKNGVVKTKKVGKTVIYAKDKKGRVSSKTLTVKHSHKYTKTKTVKPTCTKDGYKVKVCRCGKEKGKTVYKKKLGHKYAVSSSKSRTCTRDGYKKEYCTRCGDKKETALKKYGHSYELVETVKATCEKDGYNKEECRRCYDTRKTKIVKATGHKFKDYVVTESTCVKQGSKSGECLNCHKTIVLETYPLGDHDFRDVRVEPTCERDGYTKKICRVCEFQKDRVELPATGHIVGDTYTISEDSTFMDIGIEHAQCACGEREERRNIPRKDYVSNIFEGYLYDSPVVGDGWLPIGGEDDMVFYAIRNDGTSTRRKYVVEITHLGGDDFNVKVYDRGYRGGTDNVNELVADKTMSVPRYVGDLASSGEDFKRYWENVNGRGLFINMRFLTDYIFDDLTFIVKPSSVWFTGSCYRFE